MHPVLTEKIIEIVRRRHSEGDCPTGQRPGQEMVEFALMEVANERDKLRKQATEKESAAVTTGRSSKP